MLKTSVDNILYPSPDFSLKKKQPTPFLSTPISQS